MQQYCNYLHIHGDIQTTCTVHILIAHYNVSMCPGLGKGFLQVVMYLEERVKLCQSIVKGILSCVYMLSIIM